MLYFCHGRTPIRGANDAEASEGDTLKHRISLQNKDLIDAPRGGTSRTARRMSVAAAVSIALGTASLATAANAASAGSATIAAPSNMLQQIVVTASVAPTSNLRTSEQVTTIPSKLIVDMAPRSMAEMLRLIPARRHCTLAGH